MRNLYELELRMAQQFRETREEVARDRLIRRAKEAEDALSLRPALGRLRTRLGLLLIGLGARLVGDITVSDATT